MIKYSWIIALLFCTPSLAQQKVIVKGSISGDTKGYNRVFLYGEGLKTDTAIIVDGKFSFEKDFSKPVYPLFFTEYDLRIKHGYVPFGILLDEPGMVEVEAFDIADGFSGSSVSGIQSAVKHNLFEKACEDIPGKVQLELKKKYGTDRLTSEDAEFSQYTKDKDIIKERALNSLLRSFVSADPNAYASAFVLDGYGASLTADSLQSLYNILSPKQKKSRPGVSIAQRITGMNLSAIGNKVPDFILNGPDGQPVKFSQLKGKYVLLDFWASWCGPCKNAFPHMKTLYKQYGGDRFEIYSISIDEHKDTWLKSLKQQELPWLQSLDTKNISLSLFAVSAIPATYLIDPSGRILAKEDGFDPNSSLHGKIAAIMEKSK